MCDIYTKVTKDMLDSGTTAPLVNAVVSVLRSTGDDLEQAGRSWDTATVDDILTTFRHRQGNKARNTHRSRLRRGLPYLFPDAKTRWPGLWQRPNARPMVDVDPKRLTLDAVLPTKHPSLAGIYRQFVCVCVCVCVCTNRPHIRKGDACPHSHC